MPPSVSSANSNQEASVSEQEEQPSTAIPPFVGSTKIINPYFFLGEVEDPILIHAGIEIFHPEFGGRYFLPHEKAKEFLLGIDFSQFEPIDEVAELIGISHTGLIEIDAYFFGIPRGTLAITNCRIDMVVKRVAIYTLYERGLDDQDSLKKTQYFYSMSPELYDAVWERLMEYFQYAEPAGGSISTTVLITHEEEIVLEPGIGYQITHDMFPEYAMWADFNLLAWRSSDESVLTITDDGYVMAVSEGKASILVTCDLGCEVYQIDFTVVAN